MIIRKRIEIPTKRLEELIKFCGGRDFLQEYPDKWTDKELKYAVGCYYGHFMDNSEIEKEFIRIIREIQQNET